MKQENVKLIQPTLVLKAEFFEMVDEYLTAGEDKEDWRFEQAYDDFNAYVTKFIDYAQGKNLPKGWVPDSTFWLLKDNRTVLGRTSICHRLTPALEQKGGHIGYYIRPSQRGKGYGSLILALSLEKARGLELERVLVTCDDDNIASVQIIEKNGGRFTDKINLEDREVPTRRYWIDLAI